METLLNNFKEELIVSALILLIFFIFKVLLNKGIKKLGRKNGVNEARIRLICRYTSVTLFLLVIVIELFVFGVHPSDLALVFSSLFAVIGIALFAIWSILSNITSGVIMFFSFPYKVGDKIEIHDKDYPIQAIIEDIRAFQLHLRLDNGNLVTYPNNLILQKAVTLIKKDAIEDLT